MPPLLYFFTTRLLKIRDCGVAPLENWRQRNSRGNLYYASYLHICVTSKRILNTYRKFSAALQFIHAFASIFFLSFVVIDITAYLILLWALAHKRIYLDLPFRFILYYIGLSFFLSNQERKAVAPGQKVPINKITDYLHCFVWKGGKLLIILRSFQGFLHFFINTNGLFDVVVRIAEIIL